MLTAVNCYLLWGLTWLQFVITLGCFSYRGRNLWFYVVTGEPLGMTIPECFLVFSIALSVFAVCAVAGSTWRVSGLWKRVLAIWVFAGLAIGLSCLSLHLRHYCFARAVESRAEAHRIYRSKLAGDYDTNDEWVMRSFERDREVIAEFDEQIRLYREKFGNARR